MKFLVSQSFSVGDLSSVPKADGFGHSKVLFFPGDVCIYINSQDIQLSIRAYMLKLNIFMDMRSFT